MRGLLIAVIAKKEITTVIMKSDSGWCMWQGVGDGDSLLDRKVRESLSEIFFCLDLKVKLKPVGYIQGKNTTLPVPGQCVQRMVHKL